MCLLAALLPPAFCQTAADYARQVHPILAAKCWPASQEKRSGIFSRPTPISSKVLAALPSPGNSAASLLLLRAMAPAPPRMPLGAHPSPRRTSTPSPLDDEAPALLPRPRPPAKWEAPWVRTCHPASPSGLPIVPARSLHAAYLARHSMAPALSPIPSCSSRLSRHHRLLPARRISSFLDTRPGKRESRPNSCCARPAVRRKLTL